MKTPSCALTLLGAALLLTLLVVSPRAASPPASAGDSGSADAFLLDMDPAASPANAAHATGSFESCARINENDVTDADEDTRDRLLVDIVTGPRGFPATHPIIAYELALHFPAGQLAVLDEDQYLLLTANPGSSLFSVSFLAAPGEYISAAVDFSPNYVQTAESGPGVLSRLTLGLGDDADDGLHNLIIATSSSGATSPVHYDTRNVPHAPDNVAGGRASPFSRVAVDVPCPLPAAPPSPTTSPTAPPTPVPTPAPSPPPATCIGFRPTITGTQGADFLRGTRHDDIIAALGGNDTIYGLSDGDLVCGGPGDDRISGGSGPDSIFGEQGDDILSGAAGDDQFFGGPGTDTCRGGPGRDFALACETLRSADEPE